MIFLPMRRVLAGAENGPLVVVSVVVGALAGTAGGVFLLGERGGDSLRLSVVMVTVSMKSAVECGVGATEATLISASFCGVGAGRAEVGTGGGGSEGGSGGLRRGTELGLGRPLDG